ncbi:MAG: hypothetical protein DK306_000108 [Chloroflexi bacterium]|jgi:hypothetical protein|nr:MAG: hypothetical protein DK306_000108 [Chloroflexota bacterium]
MSTLQNTTRTQGNGYLLLVAALILAGIAALGVVSISTDSSGGGTATQNSSADLGSGGSAVDNGTPNAGGSAVTGGADTAYGEGEIAAQSAKCGGSGEPTSEDCQLAGTVWDGGTIWP